MLAIEIDKASPQSEISVNGSDSNVQINIRIEDITEFISVIQHLYVDTPGIATSSRAFDSASRNSNNISSSSSSSRSDSSRSPRKPEKAKLLFDVLNSMKKELDTIKLQWLTSVKEHLFEGNDMMALEEIQGSAVITKPAAEEAIRQSMLDIDTVDIRSSKLTSPTLSIYQLIGNDKNLAEENEKLKQEIDQLKREKELIQSGKDKCQEELATTKAELDVAKEHMDRLEQENMDQVEEIAQLRETVKVVSH